MPSARLVEPADDVEQRGLAGAVRADEGADLALLDGEGQPVERDDATEAHADVLDLEQRHAGPLGDPSVPSRAVSHPSQRSGAACAVVTEQLDVGRIRAVGAELVRPRAHEHDLELVVGLDAAAGAEHDALERRVDEVHRDLGLVGDALRRGPAASRRRRRGACPAR